MKINKIIVAVASFAIACSPFFAKENKGKTVVNTGQRVIIDYQGAEWGDQCPQWVRTLNTNSTANVAKELGVDTNEYQLFVAQGRGSDLDFVQAWVENIEARQKVAAAISQVVATETQAMMEGSQGSAFSETEKERVYKNSTTMASAIELNGLEQVTTFWVKTAVLKAGKKAKANKLPAAGDIATTEYTYYVVYKMTKNNWERQMQSAMANVDDNTSEQSYLKKVLAAKIGQVIYPGNDIDPIYMR